MHPVDMGLVLVVVLVQGDDFALERTSIAAEFAFALHALEALHGIGVADTAVA